MSSHWYMLVLFDPDDVMSVCLYNGFDLPLRGKVQWLRLAFAMQGKRIRRFECGCIRDVPCERECSHDAMYLMLMGLEGVAANEEDSSRHSGW